MNKLKYVAILSICLVSVFNYAGALTKPSPDSDPESLSYVFYLYYDNGQLFADRDFDIKYDILSEKFIEVSPMPGMFRVEILNFKLETVKTINFDPKNGNSSFVRGKVQVKAPYVSSGMRAIFYSDQGQQLVNIFVNEVALCNSDGACNAIAGENEKTCPSDCKAQRPRPSIAPPAVLEEPDVMMWVLYGVSGAVVIIGSWFGWKWWRKKREESFIPPAPPPETPSSPPPTPPPPGL